MVVVDNELWIEEQFGQCDFGDSRRTKRMKLVAANMLAGPEKSLPGQNTQWSELKAAYRLFDSTEVTFESTASEHWNNTKQTRPGRYLLISDTTDINLNTHKATTGLGILGDGRSRGVQLHSSLVYDSERGVVVGQAGALLHYRKLKPKGETRAQRLARVRESDLWGNLVDQIGPAPQGSQWIHVFDRGGDNFEAMCHIKKTGTDCIIRAAKLNRIVLNQSGEKVSLNEACQDAQLLGSYTLNLRSRSGVAARKATLEVSVTSVTFLLPHRKSQWVKQCGIKTLEMNVVIVQEVNAPEGVKPIRWVLLTSLPVETFDDAWQVIEDYENRWLIEEYHKVEKSGCSIEAHALRTTSRLEPLLGLIGVIAVRLFQLKLVGRNQPNAKAKTHVPKHWLKCLKLLRPKVKVSELTVYEFFRELAKLGGFLGRTGDGEPGWQTIWRGYKEMHSLLDAMRLLGQL